MLEYLCSISVKALDAYTTGLDACIQNAPNPVLETSELYDMIFSAVEIGQDW